MMSWVRVAAATLLLGCAAAPMETAPRPASAPNTPPTPPPGGRAASEQYFYTGKNYGSEAAFNPISELVNEGFDVMNTGNYGRYIFRDHLDVGFRTVHRSMAHPITVIRNYGAWAVVRNELLPLSMEGNG